MEGMRQDWETDVREVCERVIWGFSEWVQAVKLSIPAEFTLQIPTAEKTANQTEIQGHTSQMTVSVFVQPSHC